MNIAAEFVKRLKRGDVVALSGRLGAGKTMFARGAAHALGVIAPVTSPTFTILNIYEGEGVKVYHSDLYRLHSFAEAEGAGINEFIGASDGVTFVEWAENIFEIYARADYVIRFTDIPNGKEITIT